MNGVFTFFFFFFRKSGIRVVDNLRKGILILVIDSCCIYSLYFSVVNVEFSLAVWD